MVFTPALERILFICGAISGIYPMQANGLYSSGFWILSLKGSSLKRFWVSFSGCGGFVLLRLSLVEELDGLFC